MSKKLIIIGNGLGMALNPEHFSLANAMNRVWDGDSLDTKQKELIGALKGIDAGTGPTGEDELIATQIALGLLSDFRDRLGDDALDRWFTGYAKNFPHTLRRYIFEIAFDLYSYEVPAAKQNLWENFTQHFIKFIMETKSHVATLNYDDLIYEKVVNGVVIDGKKWMPQEVQPGKKFPYIRDGFINRGYPQFRQDSFDFSGDCGFYLHLHGTPLFATKGSQHIKLPRCDMSFNEETRRRHIILANPKDKRELISQSEILDNLWKKQLPRCIREANEIIVFGYSGLDEHLNERLADAKATKKWVIEWSRTKHALHDSEIIEGAEVSAEQFWTKKLGQNVQVKRLDNILDFTEWYNPDDHIPF